VRVFAVSDLHVDFDDNARWLAGLSEQDYRADVLILAGDIADSARLVEWGLSRLVARFAAVLYVPGNHELWVARGEEAGPGESSLDRFTRVCRIAAACGATTEPFTRGPLSIVPLFGWYDYSFGQPGPELRRRWIDFRACRWPDGFEVRDVAAHFLGLNERALTTTNERVLSFSHFMPRADLLPVRDGRLVLHPVLGAAAIDEQVRRLGSSVHVYGHSHVNRRLLRDGVEYINNAFGYPSEAHFTAKRLIQVV
jgi:predicted phosphodiesterase